MSGPFGSSQWMYNAGGGFYPLTIDQSLRFNDDDSSSLVRTPSSSGNLKTYTQSFWLKRGNLGVNTPSNNRFLSSSDNATGDYLLQFTGDDALQIYDNSFSLITNAKYRDPSAWYHFVVSIDTTQATSSDRVKVYVNGEQVTSFFTITYPSQNADTFFNRSGFWHAVGAYFTSYPTGGQYFDGYFAEVNFIDGQALDPTSFGEFKSGVWVANEYTGSYGTNGFHLEFANSGSLGADTSGNGNNFTATNLAATDQMLDSPTNNFCVINPVDNTGATLAEGNLRFTPTSDFQFAQGTFACSKNYFEVLFVGTLGGNIEDSIYGVYAYNGNNTTMNGAGQIYKDGSLVSSNTAYVAGDILGVAVDVPSNTIQFYRNGSTNGSSTLNANVEYMPHFKNANGRIGHANFGQDSSFAGNKTAQGNTDGNGQGDFYYSVPSGYLALCSANLPDPAIDPAQDDSPSDYFNTVLWTGNGSSQSITGVGFQPDWVWIKERSSTSEHAAFDAVRGVQKRIVPNSSAAEDTSANLLTAFNSDGFSVGSDGSLNENSQTYVGWSWLAGNGTSTNTSGSITSTVSANPTAGFSIVSWTGTGSSGTVGHSLNSTPELIINKNRSAAENWVVYSIAQPNGSQYLRLNQSSALVSDSSVFGGAPTSSVFTVGSNPEGNGNGNSHIAYCFHSVDGFSKVGLYTGNGSSDGPFVYTGFRPAWLLVKRADSAGDWHVLDQARNTYNEVENYLYPNLSDAEYGGTGNDGFDFLSNGFKVSNAYTSMNASGASVIFAAFASNPFKYANAR